MQKLVKQMQSHADNSDRVMEPETIFKNGAYPRSLMMSRGNFLKACLALSLAPAALMMGCGGSGSGSSGGGKSAKIKMTTESGNYSFNLAGSGIATVDWGDGSEIVSRTLNENGGDVRFEHGYPNASIRTITVNGDNITRLSCDDITSLDVSKNTALTRLQVSGNFTSLNVSKNTALTRLIVKGNLTSLDVSKNTALTELSVEGSLTSLDVSKNTVLTELVVLETQLTAVALNTLFGTLHSNNIPGKTKSVYIPKNPGVGTCDKSIAESKGWKVYSHY